MGSHISPKKKNLLATEAPSLRELPTHRQPAQLLRPNSPSRFFSTTTTATICRSRSFPPISLDDSVTRWLGDSVPGWRSRCFDR